MVSKQYGIVFGLWSLASFGMGNIAEMAANLRIKFINITDAPIYFSVYYKRGTGIIRQVPPLYMARPIGEFFTSPEATDDFFKAVVYGKLWNDPRLKVATFPWPDQKCVTFSTEELVALGIGVGVGGAILGAGMGAALGASVAAGEAGAIGAAAAAGTQATNAALAAGFSAGGAAAAGEAASAAALTAAGVSGITVAGGAAAGALGGAIGGTFDALIIENAPIRGAGGLCKAEHYPRTVLFSFDKQDIQGLKYTKEWLTQKTINVFGKTINLEDAKIKMRKKAGMDAALQAYLAKAGSGFYLGDNVDAAETHFLFFNPYGFDPRYAAEGSLEGHGAIMAGKINSISVTIERALALRHYLRFVNYFYFGK